MVRKWKQWEQSNEDIYGDLVLKDFFDENQIETEKIIQNQLNNKMDQLILFVERNGEFKNLLESKDEDFIDLRQRQKKMLKNRE